MKDMTVEKFRQALESGKYAWPGGYPLYFLASDGEAISFEAAREEQEIIEEAITNRDDTGGWLILGVVINWEEPDLRCAHTNELIECAKGD